MKKPWTARVYFHALEEGWTWEVLGHGVYIRPTLYAAETRAVAYTEMMGAFAVLGIDPAKVEIKR